MKLHVTGKKDAYGISDWEFQNLDAGTVIGWRSGYMGVVYKVSEVNGNSLMGLSNPSFRRIDSVDWELQHARVLGKIAEMDIVLEW